jgi:hypothetical protein
MKANRLILPILIALALSLTVGCASLAPVSPTPATAPVPSSTQPSATTSAPGLTVPAVVEDVHAVATNPAVVAGASLIPYGAIVVGALGLITTVLGSYYSNKSGEQTGAIATLQSATSTTNIADAVALAHAAIATQPPKPSLAQTAAVVDDVAQAVIGQVAASAKT